MSFEREPRYWIRRSIGTRYAYINLAGQETIAPVAFGEPWSNGQPATYTLHQANQVLAKANAGVDRDAEYHRAPVGDTYNA